MSLARNTRKQLTTRAPGKHARSAFSLIEIMVVIVIIGMLAGVLAVNVRGHMARANVSAARIELGKLYDQMEIFKHKTGKYPTPEQGLQLLLQPDPETGEPWLSQADIIDPWQNDYEYVVPGRDKQPYEIITLGADGREGGTGVDQDISHLDLER